MVELVRELTNYAAVGTMLAPLGGALAYAIDTGYELLSFERKKKREEMKFITQIVERFRKVHGIKPSPGRKLEMSCIAMGEGNNLLYVQLMNTINGEGGWKELENEDIRKDVLSQIERDALDLIK